MSGARSLTRVKAKFGAQVSVTRNRSTQSSQRNGSARNSAVTALTCSVPRTTSRTLDMTMPPTWSSGIQFSATSSAPWPSARAAAWVRARMLRWECRTHFGAPVLPEVSSCRAGLSGAAGCGSPGTASASSSIAWMRTSGRRHRPRRPASRPARRESVRIGASPSSTHACRSRSVTALGCSSVPLAGATAAGVGTNPPRTQAQNAVTKARLSVNCSSAESPGRRPAARRPGSSRRASSCRSAYDWRCTSRPVRYVVPLELCRVAASAAPRVSIMRPHRAVR
jgi:hypothetical protein